MSEERKTRRLFHPIKNGQISGGKTSAGARLEANEREAKMGAMIEFSRPDGGKSKGYLASAGNGRPGIVVIQEWWGLNDQICGIAFLARVSRLCQHLGSVRVLERLAGATQPEQ